MGTTIQRSCKGYISSRPSGKAIRMALTLDHRWLKVWDPDNRRNAQGSNGRNCFVHRSI